MWHPSGPQGTSSGTHTSGSSAALALGGLGQGRAPAALQCPRLRVEERAQGGYGGVGRYPSKDPRPVWAALQRNLGQKPLVLHSRRILSDTFGNLL